LLDQKNINDKFGIPVAELRTSLQVLSPYWGRCFLFAFVAGLLVLASTIYMLEVYDRVVNSRNTMTLLMLTLLVLFVYAVMELLEWARSETLRTMGLRWDAQLSPRLYEVSRRLHLNRSEGSQGQPLHDFRVLRDGLLNPVVGAAMEAPIGFIFLLILFSIQPILGWVSLIGALLQVGLAIWNERRSTPPLREAGRASAAAQASMEEALRHTEVISAMGLQDALKHRWLQWQTRLIAQQSLASDWAGAFQAATKFVQTVLSSGLLGISAYLLLEGDLPGGGGMLIVASVLGGRLLGPLVVLITHWRTVVAISEAWKRLSRALQWVPPMPSAMPLPPPRGHLSVESAWCTPSQGGAAVLKALQFAVSPGQVLAVIGPSGAGKSSLARLLVGVWSASQGKVRLDGADLFAWDKSELGPHLGYLPQDVSLLDGSLAENIARFGPHQPALLSQAIALAQLDELVSALPEGVHTPLGRDGIRLSGGQRQRVGLARALYGDPALVVLDEPNAHLDEEGEQALLHALQQLKARGCTVVIMTHRTSLLAVVDQLLLLREGTQQAFGPRDDVVRALQKAAQQQSSPGASS